MSSISPQEAGPMDAGLRDKLIADPDVVLDDTGIMRALVTANEKAMGNNIVDLRGIAMERLEARLDRLEDTHRSVIAAAYDNLAGTNQIHRAVLRLLEPVKFANFLLVLETEVADILRVDVIRMVLESATASEDDVTAKLGDVLEIVAPGTVDTYITMGRNLPVRQVTLRQTRPDTDAVYGDKAQYIQSEACLKLDLGEGRLPAMLVMGSEDPQLFAPQQGPDLMAFFAGIVERAMRRWLTHGA